jgi:predicted acetyltransferase
MTIEIRPPRDDEWAQVCAADGRAFANTYSPAEVAEMRLQHDLSRFRIAVDDGSVVGVAGSYALDATMPGGTTIPMGGVTWVSVASTHRRQGVMRSVVGAVHDDIDARGEPLATLGASEGGIYEHIGYGIASGQRNTVLDRRATSIRAEYRVASGSVRYIDDAADVTDIVAPLWDRFRRCRAGEVSRSIAFHDFLGARRVRTDDGLTSAHCLVHADGFAVYRLREDWNNGHPQHEMHLLELCAITPEAHVALWQTLLSVDLVGEIHSRAMAIDDPLPYLLENQRALRTVVVADGIWANVRDVSICFGARTYRTTDTLVVEADGKRWSIDGGPDGASCRSVRTKPDLITSHSGLSSLIYGGTVPSALVAGRRMTARNDAALARADLFFPTSLAPHCQTHY